jgi:H+/gluconate symporter-like permease
MTALAANWPCVVLAVSIGFIVLSIARWKLHPFLALVLAALLAGVLARVFPETTAIGGVAVIG